jgi:hypothetical protein
MIPLSRKNMQPKNASDGEIDDSVWQMSRSRLFFSENVAGGAAQI